MPPHVEPIEPVPIPRPRCTLRPTRVAHTTAAAAHLHVGEDLLGKKERLGHGLLGWDDAICLTPDQHLVRAGVLLGVAGNLDVRAGKRRDRLLPEAQRSIRQKVPRSAHTLGATRSPPHLKLNTYWSHMTSRTRLPKVWPAWVANLLQFGITSISRSGRVPRRPTTCSAHLRLRARPGAWKRGL